MRWLTTCAILAMAAGAALAAGSAAPTFVRYASPGTATVATVIFDWHDGVRQRDVPVRVYYPLGRAAPCPIIVFSHGLGGSRDGYAYLGRHWASHGYVSVHPTHAGSDTGIITGAEKPYQALQEAADNPLNALNRTRDVGFAIDELTALNRRDDTLKGRLDLDRIGVAGHSFGGYTALASAGQSFVGPRGRAYSLGDARVRAAIPMSAPAKPRDNAVLDRSYGTIRVPCFLMTGTLDNSPIGNTRAEDRRIPFDHMTEPGTCLLILAGGDHMVFSGRSRPDRAPQDARFHLLILAGSTAFWDAHLREDAAAKAWLSDGGFRDALGADGTFEQKPAVRRR